MKCHNAGCGFEEEGWVVYGAKWDIGPWKNIIWRPLYACPRCGVVRVAECEKDEERDERSCSTCGLMYGCHDCENCHDYSKWKKGAGQ